MAGWVKKDRRKQGRIYVPKEQLIEIVVLGQEHDNPGRMLDVVRNGLGAVFPRKSAPNLRVGQNVNARINIASSSGSFGVELITRNRAEESRAVRYGFQFADPGAFFGRLDKSLWHLFNQRRALRVEPDPESPIEVGLKYEIGATGAHADVQATVMVEVESESGSVVARMLDLSVLGIGVLVEQQTTLPEEDKLSISPVLPEQPSPLQLEGVVRNKRPEGESLRYGIEFVGRESDRRFRAQQKAISSYVMRRQRAMRREREQRE